MKAAILKSFKKPLVIEDVPLKRPAPQQILIKTQACGVCHSDVFAIDGEWPVKPKLPLIPGHEGIGIVEDVGERVESIKKSDRVGIPWLGSSCGKCEYCLTGQENYCPSQENTGYTVDGAYAQYVLAHHDFVVQIPTGLASVEAAPLLCAGVTTYRAVKESGLRMGQKAVVFGVGGLGHLALQFAKSTGAQVMAVDISREKLELARQLRAEATIDASSEDPSEVLQEIGGVDVALITATSPKAFEQAFLSLKPRGTMVLVGEPPGQINLRITDIVDRGIRLTGTNVGNRQDLRDVLRLAAAGIVHPYIHRTPLESVNNAVDALRESKITGRMVLEIG